MPPPELMNPVFRVLRDNGKRSALDDFGTGFNGMSLFVDFDFDVVKIDRSLIVDIDTRPAKLKVLALIGQMIDTLGKEHVVEGVETQAQSDKLHGCGFHTFQGYLLHRPEAIEGFFAMRREPAEVLP
jgi:EAL domain-containing protein (putative c-di-GMP-specific phosphodiesterase class I)